MTALGARMRFLSPVARLLLAFIFIASGLSKISSWAAMVTMMQSKGIPLASFALAAAMLVEVLCGVAVLVGFRTRAASATLFAYLIPVTLIMHNFWAFKGIEAQQQLVNFMKNLSIMGGLLTTVVFGAGEYSFDARMKD